MEENKNFEYPVWSEDQWKKWIYSFALEVEAEKIKVPFSSHAPGKGPFNRSPSIEDSLTGEASFG